MDERDVDSERSTHPGAGPGRGAGDLDVDRRRLLQAGGLGLALLASGGLLRTPLGSAVAAIVRRSRSSVPPLVDVQMLQTAASLEHVAVAMYAAALELPFVRSDRALRAFAETTMHHHSEHAAAFNAQARALGGERQEAPNPRYSPVVLGAVPTLADRVALVDLAATLEEVVTDTYLANLTLTGDRSLRTLMASVMGIEAQHVATLRSVGALVGAGADDLGGGPADLLRLPATALSDACPGPFEAPDLASPPTEGAVR